LERPILIVKHSKRTYTDDEIDRFMERLRELTDKNKGGDAGINIM
jgi:hypothetical protein